MARDAQGRYLPGPDTTRHPLTTAERRRGWRNAIVRHEKTPVGGWLRKRVRGWYAMQRRLNLARRRAG